MTTLHSGHTAYDFDRDPDGRIRVTVRDDNEIVTTATFSVTNFAAALQPFIEPTGVPS